MLTPFISATIPDSCSRIAVVFTLLFIMSTAGVQSQDIHSAIKLDIRRGLFANDAYTVEITREQMIKTIREQRSREYEDYLLNRPLVGYSGVTEQDSSAIVALYHSTGGDGWANNTNWLSDKPMYMWHGISLNIDNTKVRWIFLERNNLTGTIPDEIENLTELEVLQLSNNQLSGPIPAGIGKAANLIELLLHNNTLSGPIPAELAQLQNCTHLWLFSNELEGPIPPELGNLTDLQYLWLDNNKLTGSIPTALGTLGNLKQLTMYKNTLSGSVPDAIGQLTNLEVLWLQDNDLSYEIPSSIGNLRNLQSLRLEKNKLSGPIPDIFNDLDQLLELYLYDNRLTGSIPPSVGVCTKIEKLYLANNMLSGTILPVCALTKMKILHLGGNSFSGDIPAAFGDLDSLQGIWLYSNQLDGSIPPELGRLKKLWAVGLYLNNLTGPIPPELGDLENLELLWLDYNRLTGPIPGDLGKLKNLSVLDLSTNELTGPIPPEVGQLTNLEELYLYENALTDTIPHELGDLSKLTMLAVGRNKLKEPTSVTDLQTAFLRLTELQWFLADRNEFTKFPDISSLPNLNTLEIQSNCLHFDSIEPHIGITNLRYAPQDSVGPERLINATPGVDVSLALQTLPPNPKPISVGGLHNQYQWFRGNEPIAGATNPSHTIVQPGYLDTGHYILRITNTVATVCTLYSRQITVKVEEEVNLNYGSQSEVSAQTLGIKIAADVTYAGKLRILYFNSAPKPGNPPEGILRIADLYFSIDADPSLQLSNAKIMIPVRELADRGIDVSKIKWLKRPESGKGEWITLQGKIEGDYFVSEIPFDSFSEFTFGLTEVTSVDQEIDLPNEYRLYQNYPNPFNPTTTIRFSIPERQNVLLTVYDLLGREVARLVNEELDAGLYSVVYDGTELASGVYLYRIQTDSFASAKCFILLK
jgi:Leucine-rich repeat (LRR) protein